MWRRGCWLAGGPRLRWSPRRTCERIRTRPRRSHLLAALLHIREREITDTLVELLIATVHRINARAEKKVTAELINAFKKVTDKENILFSIAEASLAAPEEKVRRVVYPAIAGGEATLRELVHEYRTKGPVYRTTVATTLRASYTNHYRRGLIRLLEQVRNGNRLIAVRAESADADPAAGAHAVGAPLLAEVAHLAFIALIDGGVSAGPGRRDGEWVGLDGGMAAPPRCAPAAPPWQAASVAHAIARACRISRRTVEKHIEHAYAKLGIHDRLSAVNYCRRVGLLV